MAKTKINMINLMNLAWERRQQYGSDEYAERVKNLVSHSYVEYEKMFKEYCKNKGVEYKEEIFITYQHVFVFLMLCDGDFLQGEYDAYCKYCKWAGFQALTVDETRSLYNRLTTDDLVNDIKLLVDLREYIDPENYEAMVQGFCYFTLSGDKEMDENEYYILRCFFETGYDYAPATWDQFKKEW